MLKPGDLIKVSGQFNQHYAAIKVPYVPSSEFYRINHDNVGIYLGDFSYLDADKVPPIESERHQAIFGEIRVWIDPDYFVIYDSI